MTAFENFNHNASTYYMKIVFVQFKKIHITYRSRI